jgi:formylglycine-generating enzyme required for sulfatase activity
LAPIGGWSEVPGGFSFSGWTVGGQGVDLHNTYHTTAHSGNQSLDLSGEAPGSIAQSVVTTPGTTYRLSFWYSGQPFHPYDGDAYAEVFWNRGLVDAIHLPASPLPTDINWTFASYELPANTTSTLLTFDSLSPNGGIMLDDISLDAVPEPSSLVLLSLGAVSLLAYAWRRCRTLPKVISIVLLALAINLAVGSVRADVFHMGTGLTSLETVPVGDPGNVGELSGAGVGNAGAYGPDQICGAVNYEYNIGKYEVTAAQYTEFLNAVAKTDTNSLYSTNMWNRADGCKIQRTGVSGNYSYSVSSVYANRPVNCVGFWDACRFTNWLQNGQPKGSQGEGTTETGAYTLTAAGINNNTVVRNANWKWAVPSEDEWYKAAFYKGGSANAGYWDIPTSSDIYPGRDMADASGNNANYYLGSGTYPIDSGIYTTVVGEFQNSPSPYGTFDQAGNVWEWNDTIFPDLSRGLRGASFDPSSGNLYASDRYSIPFLTYDSGDVGFRVVGVPEPGSLAMLAAIAAATFPLWRRRAHSKISHVPQ